MDRYTRSWWATNLLTRQGHSFSGHERHCFFLNLGGRTFADASAAVHFDLPEDGRSMACVDWDQDGDQDIWMTNRTAPRLRYFRNDYPQGQSYVSVRLRGRTGNRDAIGARVELILSHNNAGRRLKTVRAGDGFLGQSSKTLHFGLGHASTIDQLVIHWPGGSVEQFVNLAVNQRYVAVEGQGLQPDLPRVARPTLVSSELRVPEMTEEARIVLLGRMPFPDAPYVNQDGQATSLVAPLRGPTLVCLWADWCRPCLEELQAITRSAARLRDQRLEVIALSLPDEEHSGIPATAARVMQRLRFPFTWGAASRELVRSLDLFQQTLLDRKRTLPVPCTFLLDGKGQIAIIYKGKVGVDRLTEDLQLLEASGRALREAAVPLPGRWFTPPVASNPMQIAGALLDHGLTVTAERYAEQLQTHFATSRQQVFGSPDRPDVSAQLSELYAFRGKILLGLKRSSLAIPVLKEALNLNPHDRPSHLHLAVAYTQQRMLRQAATHFRAALKIDPNDADTHYNLAIGLTQLGRHEEAVQHYWEVLRLRPAWPPAANNLAWILATHSEANIRDGEAAVRLAKRVCEQVSQDPSGLATLAAAYAEAGQFELAVTTTNTAIDLAAERNDAELKSKLESRRALFQVGRAYRDPALVNDNPSPSSAVSEAPRGP